MKRLLFLLGMFLAPILVQGADTLIDFTDQPAKITTNLAQFPVIGYVGKSDYRVSINGGPKLKTSENGYRAVVDLALGANKISVVVYDSRGRKKSTVTKTVVCDPLYKMSKRELLYAADNWYGDTIVIDLPIKAVVGVIAGTSIIKASPDGKWIVDYAGNFISVDDPSIVRENPLGFSAGYSPLFSRNGRYAMLSYVCYDVWNNVFPYRMPVEIFDESVALPNGQVLAYFLYNHEVRIAVINGPKIVGKYPSKVSDNYKIDPTGNYGLWSGYYYGEGYLNLQNMKTGKKSEWDGLSDYMGDLEFSPDGKWGFAGSFGNSWFGGGKIYVVDLPNRKIKSSYERFGASSLAISQSGRTVYIASCWVADRHGGDWDDRGVEVLSFDSKKGKLSRREKYYLKSQTRYPYPDFNLLEYKPAAK